METDSSKPKFVKFQGAVTPSDTKEWGGERAFLTRKEGLLYLLLLYSCKMLSGLGKQHQQ